MTMWGRRKEDRVEGAAQSPLELRGVVRFTCNHTGPGSFRWWLAAPAPPTDRCPSSGGPHRT